jgi:hypothetical protein
MNGAMKYFLSQCHELEPTGKKNQTHTWFKIIFSAGHNDTGLFPRTQETEAGGSQL